MNKSITSVLIAGLLVLLVSLGILYIGIFAFPSLMEEYYNSVFRSSSFDTDWLFYAHPFVLSAALKWFWDRSRDSFNGSLIWKAAGVSLAYGLVAMLPVLWLTFTAKNPDAGIRVGSGRSSCAIRSGWVCGSL